ncbi:MAG: ABC transporter permease [Actinomycetota bacterium]
MGPIASVYRSRELLWNLTLRELRTKYRRSFLGWTWSMLNPLATVAIYSFVFGVLFKSSAPVGEPSGLKGFAYFLLAALLPWNFFALVTNLGMGSIASNSGLVRRVAFPREVLVFSNSLHACVQFGIEIGLLCVVLLVAGSPIIPWIPVMFLVSFTLAIFASGIALALSALSVYFRDLTYLWTIFLQVWFFLTPVVYGPSLLEERAPRWAERILDLNPMRAFVSSYRDLLYDARCPSGSRFVFMAASALLSISLGWIVFHRMGRRLPEEV